MQAEFDQLKIDKFDQKKQNNKTFEGFLEYMITNESIINRLIELNKNYATKNEEEKE